MKVESVVTGVDRYSHPGDRQRNDYVFETGYDVLVPIGAKVTVEWDDDVHQCKEARRSSQIMRRRECTWALFGMWGVYGAEEQYFGIATYCLRCGKKLGG